MILFDVFSLISLFVDESKVTDDVCSHLNVDEKRKNEEKVKIRPYEDIKEAVMELNKMKKNVWVRLGGCCASHSE